MEPAPALTAESFSALNLFLHADWVVKGVLIGLVLASLWSWAIILDKLVRFAALNRQANAFEDAVGSGRSLEDVAAQAGEQPTHPLPRMLVVAMREWRESRVRGAALSETQGQLLIQRIDRGLDGVIARETQKTENGLGSLAIVATSTPFIGLFGTVWGIMNAFQEIAIQRSTNLAVVAPAIAEALFATAIGLIAAIPAYIAYNKFSTDAARFASRLEGFADDLTTAIARRLAQPAAQAPRGAA
jgi:biopolymer transport protein TolQ